MKNKKMKFALLPLNSFIFFTLTMISAAQGADPISTDPTFKGIYISAKNGHAPIYLDPSQIESAVDKQLYVVDSCSYYLTETEPDIKHLPALRFKDGTLSECSSQRDAVLCTDLTLGEQKIEETELASLEFKGILPKKQLNMKQCDFIQQKGGRFANIPKSLQYINGMNLFMYWDKIEPSIGQYDFSYFDKQLKALKKMNDDYYDRFEKPLKLKAIIGIMPASYALDSETKKYIVKFPQWFWDTYKDTKSITSLTKDEGMYSGCSEVTIPVPWDENLRERWKKVITEFGHHYDQYPPELKELVGAVQLQALLFFNRRNNLPNNYQSNKVCGNRNSTTPTYYPNDVDNWVKLNYTPGKIEGAVDDIMKAYKTAFSSLPHLYTTSSNALPRINANGVKVNSAVELARPTSLIEKGYKIFGSNFYPQTDAMSAYKTDALIFGATQKSDNRFSGFRDGWLTSIDADCLVTGEGAARNPSCLKASVLQDDYQQAQMSGGSYIMVAQPDIIPMAYNIDNLNQTDFTNYDIVNQAAYNFFNSNELGKKILSPEMQDMTAKNWKPFASTIAPAVTVSPPYEGTNSFIYKLTEDASKAEHGVFGRFLIKPRQDYVFNISAKLDSNLLASSTQKRYLQIIILKILKNNTKIVAKGVFDIASSTKSQFYLDDSRGKFVKLEKNQYLESAYLSGRLDTFNPWRRISMKFRAEAAKEINSVGLRVVIKTLNNADINNATFNKESETYTGDNTSSIYFWKPQIVPIQNSVKTLPKYNTPGTERPKLP